MSNKKNALKVKNRDLNNTAPQFPFCKVGSKIVPGFLGGAVVENVPANAGDMGSSPGLGRSHMPRSN